MANDLVAPTSQPLALNEMPSGVRISAKSDAQAVMAWLDEYTDSPQTWKAYRRESERLLLWLASQQLALTDITRELLRRYEAFLADPQPSEQWVGASKPRAHPAWRPFRGALSPASRRQSLVILQGMFAWLVEAGWVSHNPFRLMRDKSRRLNNQAPRIERYLESDLWAWLWQWLNTPEAVEQEVVAKRPIEKGNRARFEQSRLRVIFGFAYLLAPRISEMADARMSDFQRSEGQWWWHVVGKGSKMARIPLPDDMLDCLGQWRQVLGLPHYPSVLEANAPLLRALDGQRGLGHNQLYRLIKATFQKAAQSLEEENGPPQHVAALRQATPHWLRHTSITHQAQSGISLRHLAESARHARLDTTSRYLHNEDMEWHSEQQRHRLSNSPSSRYNVADVEKMRKLSGTKRDQRKGSTMSTSGAEQAQQELIEDFEIFDNWMDRYQYIIDMGKQLPEFPEDWKTDEFKIQGCQSNVWMRHEEEGDKLLFRATSDAAIVSGLIAVLLRIYSGRTAAEIRATEPHFLADLGLDKHLSPTRSNGLHAMVESIYSVAQQHK